MGIDPTVAPTMETRGAEGDAAGRTSGGASPVGAWSLLHQPDSEVDAALERVDHLVLQVLASHAQGPLLQMTREHMDTRGKRVRAKLALAAAKALGGRVDQAVGWAAACELMHNASLVHDDLQDGDTVRRGQPSVWARYGMEQAINVGDLLLMLPYLVLDRDGTSPELGWRLSQALARRAAATVCGQSSEQMSRTADELTWQAYDRAALGKTGQFFALPIEGAALIAGHSALEARRLGDAMLRFGLLFQLRDDVLDLYGDKGRRDRGNDLREGKLSALVVAHIERRPQDRGSLLATLREPREHTRATDIDAWAQAFAKSGALLSVVVRAKALVGAIEERRAWSRCPRLKAAIVDMAHALAQPLLGLSLPV